MSHPLPVVVVADADPATRGLLEEWLGAVGWCVRHDGDPAAMPPGAAAVVVIVDVPRPRGGDDEAIRRVRERYPGVPVLAISPTFLPNVPPGGACARSLGVERVLPKPMVREHLLLVVDTLAGSSR